MSDENLTLALQSYAAWNRGDSSWFLDHITEDAGVQPIRGLAGFSDVYRGPEGWKEFWKVWSDAWSLIEISVQHMEDMGDRGVLVLLSFEGVGGDKEAEVSKTVSHWLKFRDGRLSEMIAMPRETADRRREVRA